MRDLTIELTHRPGELARVASTLARHRVTLKAGCALTIGPRLIARLIPSDIDAARRALDAAEVRFKESELVKVLLESRAGELAMLSSRLTEDGSACGRCTSPRRPGSSSSSPSCRTTPSGRGDCSRDRCSIRRGGEWPRPDTRGQMTRELKLQPDRALFAQV